MLKKEKKKKTTTKKLAKTPKNQFCSTGVRLCQSLRRCSKHHQHKLNIYSCQTLIGFYKLLISLFDLNFLGYLQALMQNSSLHSVDRKKKNGTSR